MSCLPLVSLHQRGVSAANMAQALAFPAPATSANHERVKSHPAIFFGRPVPSLGDRA